MLAILIANLALATTYSDTVDIYARDSSVPSNPWLERVTRAHKIAECNNTVCPDFTGSTVRVNSSWSKAKCSAHKISADHYLYTIDFLFTYASWPTSAEWNSHSSVTCSYTNGSDTYNVTVNISSVETYSQFPSELLTANLSVPALIDGLKGYHSRTFTLAAGDWTERGVGNSVQCRKGTSWASGTTWTGVKAYVDDSAGPAGQDIALITTSTGTPEGTGFCRLVRSGTNYDLPVTVDFL